MRHSLYSDDVRTTRTAKGLQKRWGMAEIRTEPSGHKWQKTNPVNLNHREKRNWLTHEVRTIIVGVFVHVFV